MLKQLLELFNSLGVELSEEQVSKFEKADLSEIESSIKKSGMLSVEEKYNKKESLIIESAKLASGKDELSIDEALEILSGVANENKTLKEQADKFADKNATAKEALEIQYKSLLANKENELKSIQEKYRNTQIENTLLPMFSNAIRPDESLEIFRMRNNIELDDSGSLIIKDKEGNRYTNASGYLSNEDIVNSFFADRPDSIRASDQGAGGGTHKPNNEGLNAFSQQDIMDGKALYDGKVIQAYEAIELEAQGKIQITNEG